MIWTILIIIFMLLAFISISICMFSKSNKHEDLFNSLIRIGAVGFFVSLFLLIGFSAYADILMSIPNYSDTEKLYSSNKLENLQDNRDIEGEFSGNLFYTKGKENTEYYYYFMKWEDDVLVPDKIKASDIKINYISDNETPHIDKYVYYEKADENFSEQELFWLTFRRSSPNEKALSYRDAYYLLCVPESSVNKDYNIDLK